MGIPVLILGESGSGKSTSLRNFTAKEIGVFNVASKPLPFRKKLPVINGSSYGEILNTLKAGQFKSYAIDDSQYLLAFEFFDRAKETGYNKFTDIALNFRNLIQFVITQTPPDCIVYFLHHTETLQDGTLKAKTIGKMLDEEEYQKNDGSTGTRLYVVAARSVQAIRDGDFTVPAKKLLAAPTTAQRFAAPESGTQGFGGFTMMDEDDGDQLPF